MYNEFERTSARILKNALGWRTNRKIIVIESDDWGSIRMPSWEVYNKCLAAGYPVDKISFERYDSLASQEDLVLLFDLLTSFKDKNGDHPVITANCVVANPDFKKIRESNFNTYHYELITQTFMHYPNHSNNFNIWKQGLSKKIFFPQFHAREHLNVRLFMDALKKGDQDAHWGFKNEMPGSIPKGPIGAGNIFVEATNFINQEDKAEKLAIYLEGLNLFEKLWGFKSETIIPPNYTWSKDYNQPVFGKGVSFFQGNRKMKEPIPNGKPLYHNHFLGQKNNLGQRYLVRNGIFEPSMFRLKINDPADYCLKDISAAFRMRKPAIISSHRINYVGFIDPGNRDNTLFLLSKIFKEALKKWPDIEFMSSVQLARLFRN